MSLLRQYKICLLNGCFYFWGISCWWSKILLLLNFYLFIFVGWQDGAKRFNLFIDCDLLDLICRFILQYLFNLFRTWFSRNYLFFTYRSCGKLYRWICVDSFRLLFDRLWFIGLSSNWFRCLKLGLSLSRYNCCWDLIGLCLNKRSWISLSRLKNRLGFFRIWNSWNSWYRQSCLFLQFLSWFGNR